LKGITISLKNFKGDADKIFWGWCFTIARNKVNDHLRKVVNELAQPYPPDELGRLVEASALTTPLSPEDRHDLDYALKLLDRSKPECRDYLWKHFVVGLKFTEIAEEQNVSDDSVRMKINRCLETVKALVA
jgi:RNA polymerase sigma factor (sigma-70 family)